MMHVNEQPVPAGFDFETEVRSRGHDTIRQLAGLPPLVVRRGQKTAPETDSIDKVNHKMLRKHPHWQLALDALHTAYDGICAYACLYIEKIHLPTVDHFVAIRNSVNPMMAYEWNNYRLACGLMNGCKSAFQDVLDPFEIEDGWLGINFGTFATSLGPSAPAERRAAIVESITRLKLDGPEICETRRRAFRKYMSPPTGCRPVPLWSLEADHPFLVREMRRQRRLRSEDLPPEGAAAPLADAGVGGE